MKFKLLITALLAGSFCNAQSVYSWAKGMGNTNDDQGKSMALDASGNVYVTGTFKGMVDFDPGSNIHTLTATGTSQDIFIAKYDANGNYLWAVSYGNSNEDIVNDIAVDASGNVYTTGYFVGTIDFDPGAGTQNLTSVGSQEAYVLKINTAGDYVWAKPIGGTGSNLENSNTIAVDASGNVIIGGTYSGNPDFDAGTGTQNLTVPAGQDMFLCKWDANGNFIWVKGISGNSIESPVDIVTDASGYIYICGYFLSTTNDFDPGAGVVTLPNVGLTDIFISKLDANGEFVWAKSMGSTAYESGQSIAADGSGNVYITGGFSAKIDFDPSASAYELTPTATDIYILKLNSTGNFVWAKQIGGAGDQNTNALVLDAAGDIYTTGYYTANTDFDPSPTATHTLTNAGSNDIFISKLNASGDFVWAKGIGGTSTDVGVAIAVNGIDNVYLAGYFKGAVDFDPDAGTQSITAAGSTNADVFIGRYISSSSLPLTLLQLQAENKGTEVQLIWQTSQEENTASFSVERNADGKVFIAIGSVAAVNNATLKNNYTFTDAQPVNGTAYYRLKMIDVDGRFTYSHFVSVRNNNNTALQIAPNPASNVLYVQAKGEGPVTVQITDINGRILQQQRIMLTGNTSFTVNIQQLLPGSYYLIVKGNELNQIEQFIKQ